jgi:hypothetical protein
MDSNTTALENGNASNASNGSHDSGRTFIHDLFEGILTSETRCLTCETVSSRDEAFLDLSIDIEPNSSVTSCLRQFSASEMLCQRNKFSCDSCAGLQEAERRMKVKKLPSILALHLKRFKYQEDVQRFIKLSYRVAFPLELRLFNTVDDADNADRLYELFAIVVHIGGGPHHGHYTTIVRSRGAWVVFDDDTVESVKESDIPKYFGDSNVGAGYVLFYQAADLAPPSATSQAEPQPKPKEAVEEEPLSAVPIPEPSNLPLEIPVAPESNHVPHDSHLLKAENSPTMPKREGLYPPEFHGVLSSPSQVKPSIVTNGEAHISVAGPSSATGQDDQKRGWFSVGRSKSGKKRPKDAVPLLDAPPAPYHSRARTTGGLSEYESNGDVLDVRSPTSASSHAPFVNGKGASATSTVASEGEVLDIRRRNSSSSESRPSTALTTNSQPNASPSLAANVQFKDVPPLPQQPSPTAESVPQDTSHVISKKASRKMSLTAMPSRLTGLIGRKDRDKDHG